MFGIKISAPKINLNPIKAIENVVKDVSKAVTQVNKDVTSSIARSDIGKAAGAGMAPITALKDANIDILSGNPVRGINRMIGASLVSNPVSMTINASSSVRSALKSDIGNTLTLGWGRDAAEVTARGSDIMSTGRNVNKSDVSSYTRYGIRSVGIAAGAGYLAGTLGGSGGAAATGAGIGETVGAAVLPELGGAVKDAIGSLRSPTAAAPSSSSSKSPIPAAMGSVLGILVLLAIFKKGKL